MNSIVRSITCLLAATAWLALWSAGAAGQGAPGAAAEEGQPRFSVTIYSTADPVGFDPAHVNQRRGRMARYERGEYELPGYGVVRENRRIDLKAGVNDIRFTDVAAGIDPTTVSFKSFTDPSAGVLEQNFEYDVMSPEKLLEKFIGREIIINRKQPPLEGEKTIRPETIQGKLLAFDEGQILIETSNRQLPVQIIPRNADIQEIKFFNLATGLVTKPTLFWKITSEKAGGHDVQVSYQTNGLTWRADYSIVAAADDASADVSAWVTLLNESGVSYPDARLKLVAGNVNRFRDVEIVGNNSGGLFGGGKREMSEKPLFEYHLYTLPRATSLPNNSTKQVELFAPRSKVPVVKRFVFDTVVQDRRHRRGEIFSEPQLNAELNANSAGKIDVYLQLQNDKKSGLGIPLPAGRIRAYKRDEADGALEFVGEDAIDHTPADERVMIRLGSAFDVVGERKQMNFSAEGLKTASETFEIRVRNHKKQAIAVDVRETLYRWHQWEITKASEKYDKRDAGTIVFPIEVGADQEKVITYTVKYSW